MAEVNTQTAHCTVCFRSIPEKKTEVRFLPYPPLTLPLSTVL